MGLSVGGFWASRPSRLLEDDGIARATWVWCGGTTLRRWSWWVARYVAGGYPAAGAIGNRHGNKAQDAQVLVSSSPKCDVWILFATPELGYFSIGCWNRLPLASLDILNNCLMHWYRIGPGLQGGGTSGAAGPKGPGSNGMGALLDLTAPHMPRPLFLHPILCVRESVQAGRHRSATPGLCSESLRTASLHRGGLDSCKSHRDLDRANSDSRFDSGFSST